MNRKQFIESLGGEYWPWAWSFSFPEERLVIFPAWDVHEKGGTCEILSEGWRLTNAETVNAAYSRARKHIALVEDEGWELKTFVQYKGGEDPETGTWKIGGIEPKLESRRLSHVGKQWFAIAADAIDPVIPEELSESEEAQTTEGAKSQVTVNVYERSPEARLKCLAHYGRSCAVCDFNFGEVFGPHGEGFIHVHHLIPVSQRGGEYVVDAINDLRPVCPNCHAMIHRTRQPLTIEALRELREKIQAARLPA
jgi:5-methylcytosine-specific restriction protein A